MMSKVVPLLWGITLFFCSCQQGDIEKINEITDALDEPSQSWKDSEMIYSEHGIPRIKIEAPYAERFPQLEEPFMEFPEGFYVEFYDSLKKPQSSIRSNYAIYKESEQLWIAENDVVAINTEGDTLNTEYLVWDMEKEKIHTDRYVRIINKDGIIHGVGFEAAQDFTNWRIKNTSGTFYYKDEDN